MSAKSQKQQMMMAMALAMKRGKLPIKGGAGKISKSMKEEDIEEFAKTKRKLLPKKVSSLAKTMAKYK